MNVCCEIVVQVWYYFGNMDQAFSVTRYTRRRRHEILIAHWMIGDRILLDRQSSGDIIFSSDTITTPSRWSCLVPQYPSGSFARNAFPFENYWPLNDEPGCQRTPPPCNFFQRILRRLKRAKIVSSKNATFSTSQLSKFTHFHYSQFQLFIHTHFSIIVPFQNFFKTSLKRSTF